MVNILSPIYDCFRIRKPRMLAPRPIVSFLVSAGGWVTWKQLFEEEVPVSVEVRTYSQSSAGGQVGQATGILCLNLHSSGCMCVPACAFRFAAYNTERCRRK